MMIRNFLALGLVLVLLSHARADKFPAGPPRPKLFASEYGTYAFKVLPDASSVDTRRRTEGTHSPAQAGQAAGKSEGVFFTLDENGNEKVIWRAKLANIPNRAILVESGKCVITLDSWHSIGFDHCLVVYGEQGKVIADFKLEDLLTPEEIEGLPGSITHRAWSDEGIAEFEDRSRDGEIVIRIKYKDWTKVIRLSLSSGQIINDPPSGAIICGLSAKLSNLVVRSDNSIELDFILLNHSDAEIVLAERWNSWGTYQWEFRIVDAKGAEFVLRNPQTAWYRNGFTTFTVPPSKEHITRCRLDRASWKNQDGPVAVFSEVGIRPDDKRRQNSWAFPLSITGTFSAPKENLNVIGEPRSNWAGTITANTVQAETTFRPESHDDRGAVQSEKPSGGEPAKQPQSKSSSGGLSAGAQAAGVESVVLDGIEYRAVHDHDEENGKPSGMRGIIEARNAKSKDALWRVQVYDIRYRENSETGDRDVFIKDLKFDETLSSLTVTDDRGRRFLVNPQAPFLLARPKTESAKLAEWYDSVARSAQPFQATTGENTWLLFRSTGISSADQLRIESAERQGSAFTVTMKYEMYLGPLWANAVEYRVSSVDLGKLPAGNYQAKLLIKTTAFGPGIEPPKEAPASDQAPSELGLTSAPTMPSPLIATRSFTVLPAQPGH